MTRDGGVRHRRYAKQAIRAGALDCSEPNSDCDRMKNITVSVDDEMYHRARMWAAEQRSSVSAMVRQMLREVAAQETPFERLHRQERELRERLRSRGVRFAASDRLSRDALHDRHALR